MSARCRLVLTVTTVCEEGLARVKPWLPGNGMLTLWGHIVCGPEQTGFALQLSDISQRSARRKSGGLPKRVAG